MRNHSLINTKLGKYLIQAEIGRGGMGAVYRAYDTSLDRNVAIKVLAPHLVWEKEFVERFLREAKAAARLKHPGIVTIHDVGQESDWYYFVMEYLQGHTLTEIIHQQGPLPSDKAISYLKQMADALDYAHQNGLVHRDIKPGNIVISQMRATLTDFGIARAGRDTRLTATGTIVGTPEYMSPEQTQGLETDARSDQYSLAVVAYELLSGQVPFQAESAVALLYKVVHETPPPISQVRPDLPKGVEAVLDRALAKQPDERFETVKAFVETLEKALAGQAIKLPKRRSAIKLPAWLWALGAVSLLGLIVALVLLLGNSGGSVAPTSTPTTGSTAIAVATKTATPQSSATPDQAATNAIDTVIAAAKTIGAPTAVPATTVPVTASPTAVPATRTTRPTSTLRRTSTPSPTPKPGATSTRRPTSTSGSSSSTATSKPQPTTPPSSGALVTFEQMGSWRRGDQPYGELAQTNEKVHSGSYAAKLSYAFPGSSDDFVVFIQPRSVGGQPNRIGAWVYGDGSSNFANIWVQDAQNEIWQFTLGRVSGTGWRQMVGTIDPNLSWPTDHISGPSNSTVDYPISFYALVLSRPDGATNGQIYVDDISFWWSDQVTTVTPPAVGPTATPVAGQPTTPPSTEAGRIIFTVKSGSDYFLYSTDPTWGHMTEIGRTDWNNSTCPSNTPATLDGRSFNLYWPSRCTTGGIAECISPDGQYKVITNQLNGDSSVALWRASDNTSIRAYYQGPLNNNIGIVWAHHSQAFMFAVNRTVNRCLANTAGYIQVIPEIDTSWPPQYSPDGSVIYYLKPVGSVGASDIFMVDANGNNASNLTNNPNTQKLCPRWQR